MHNKKTTKKPTQTAIGQDAVKKSLSLIEDKELRKKIRNRQSALAARERKKARMLMLERKVRELELKHAKLYKINQKNRELHRQMMQQMKRPPFTNYEVNQNETPRIILDNQLCGSWNGNFQGNDSSVNGIHASTNPAVSMSNVAPNTLSNNLEHIPFEYKDGSQDEYGYSTSNYSNSRRGNVAQSLHDCRASLPYIENSSILNGGDNLSLPLDWISEYIPPLLDDTPADFNTESRGIVLEKGASLEYSSSGNTINGGSSDIIHDREYQRLHLHYPLCHNADMDMADASQYSCAGGCVSTNEYGGSTLK